MTTDIKAFAESEIRRLTQDHAMLTQRAEQCVGAIMAYRALLEQVGKEEPRPAVGEPVDPKDPEGPVIEARQARKPKRWNKAAEASA